MSETKHGPWKQIKATIRNRLVSGTLVLVPLVVTLLVIRWVFLAVAAILRPVVKYAASLLAMHPAVQSVPEMYVNSLVWLLSIVVLVGLVYLVGLVAQFVVGRRLIAAGEFLLLKIPLVRSIYAATKEVIQAISLPDRAAFKSVVMVEFPRPGFRAIGFLTGRMADPAGRRFCAVFIPTAPNPTTGFFEIVAEEDVVETSLSLEEAFRTIISCGVVRPETLLGQSLAQHVAKAGSDARATGR